MVVTGIIFWDVSWLCRAPDEPDAPESRDTAPRNLSYIQIGRTTVKTSGGACHELYALPEAGGPSGPCSGLRSHLAVIGTIY